MKRLHLSRNNKIHGVFHKVSRYLVNYCKENDIGTLMIGHNERWKQGLNLGRRTNQNFVGVPFSDLLRKITYKVVLIGIQVLLQEDSYTSMCSFLDWEPIKKTASLAGRLISRGLFQSAESILINAYMSGSYNILRKAVPNSFTEDGIEDVELHPVLVSV